MKWLDKMELKFGKYAIPNLMYYIIILYALGFVVQVVSPNLYASFLALDAAAILRGEVWRIFTFIMLHVFACLGIYLVTGNNMSYGTMYLNMSLFFAFAALFPDVQFLLFFIIPIKCKYLGYANGLYFMITIISGFVV